MICSSDLHLEFTQNRDFLRKKPLQPKGNVLLLAGDIVPFAIMDRHEDFFSYISDHFETTYWIPGNHEYYHSDLDERCGTLNQNIKKNVHLVNNLMVEHGEIRFIFSTLWTKISQVNQWKIEGNLSDFQVIKFNHAHFYSDQYNRLFEESLSFLKEGLHHRYTGKTIVVTHHVSTFLNYPEKYKDDILNEAFAVELYDLIEASGPEYWIFGHHHTNVLGFEIGKTKLMTNQVGYVQYGEHVHFRTAAIFKV
ncbi:metallophosphoesterase [Gaoshiqia sp. Z1-71]|uniref:metallophosphoesterase n=1 Tax=Gaoshiqia hydrogeniformans TaxID=3290090 RepID=UPI003BF8BDAE